MWAPILQMIAPLVVWIIGRFIKNQEKRDEMAKAFYEFTQKHGEKAADRVARLIDLEKRLKMTIEELEKLKKEEAKS